MAEVGNTTARSTSDGLAGVQEIHVVLFQFNDIFAILALPGTRALLIWRLLLRNYTYQSLVCITERNRVMSRGKVVLIAISEARVEV